MKLIFALAFLALICAARSAPPASPKDRTLVLPSYDGDEEEIIPGFTEDSDEDSNTTTTTTSTTRRSTYVFPTRVRTTPAPRRPWLTPRTTTVDMTEIDIENPDITGGDHGFSFITNVREFFKRMWDDVKKFLKKVTGFDIINYIKNLFRRRNDD